MWEMRASRRDCAGRCAVAFAAATQLYREINELDAFLDVNATTREPSSHSAVTVTTVERAVVRQRKQKRLWEDSLSVPRRPTRAIVVPVLRQQEPTKGCIPRTAYRAVP
jgi:hypothetical protein